MRRAVILDFHMGIRHNAPYARAILALDGAYYLADMTRLSRKVWNQAGVTECMIFKCDRKGKVKNWSEINVWKNHKGVSRKNLMDCILDFCNLADFEKSRWYLK